MNMLVLSKMTFYITDKKMYVSRYCFLVELKWHGIN